MNGAQVNNSKNIIDHVAAIVAEAGGQVANTGDADEAKWLEWVDSVLVKTTAPNLYRTMSEAVRSFGYISEQTNFRPVEAAAAKYIGAALMFVIGRGLTRKYGYGDDPRGALYSAINEWLEAGVGSKRFHGGEVPDAADLAVFGVLRALRPYDAGEDAWAATDIDAWYQRMAEIVGPSSTLHTVGQAPALPHDTEGSALRA